MHEAREVASVITLRTVNRLIQRVHRERRGKRVAHVT